MYDLKNYSKMFRWLQMKTCCVSCHGEEDKLLHELELADPKSIGPEPEHEVFLAPYVKTVGPVDPKEMTVGINIDVSVRWECPDIIEQYTDEDGDIRYRVKAEIVENPDDVECWEKNKDKFWCPNFYLDNTVDDELDGKPDEIKEYAVVRDPKTGKPMISMYCCFKKVTSHTFNLKEFPYERLGFKFFFALDQLSTEAVFKLHDPDMFFDCMKISFSEEADSEADAYDIVGARLVPDVCVEEWSKVMFDNYGLRSEAMLSKHAKAKFSNMEFRVDVRRAYFFYTAKIMTVIFIVMLLMVSTFYIPVDDLSDRLGMGVTLFLTAVAFQFVTNDSLPELSYLTTLDKLIGFMYLTLTLGMLENVLVYQYEALRDYENGFMTAYILSVFLSSGWILKRAYLAQTTIPKDFSHVYFDTLETFNEEEVLTIRQHKLWLSYLTLVDESFIE
mmetsp:Transcript_20065/g.28999  ORF Transcript_20065/g.28999 Transcript_20065/m.28999 type:complete len:445 (-) Transcript_20065:280-1614(-)